MRSAIRWSGLVGLMALVACQALPARAADGPVSDIFQRAETSGRASLAGLDVLPFVAPGAMTPAIAIRCDFSCLFPGFCFKYVNRNVTLDLSPSRTNHTTYPRAVLEALSGDVPRIRQSSAEVTNQLVRLDRAATQLKDATTEGMASAEAEFRQALGSAIVGTHDLREQALRGALALEGRTNQLGRSPEFSRNDTDRWIRQTKAQIKADERCYAGQEAQVEVLRPAALVTIQRIEVTVEPTLTAARSAATALRALSRAANDSYNALGNVDRSAVPGFAQVLWKRLSVAGAAANSATESSGLDFFNRSCSELDWCKAL